MTKIGLALGGGGARGIAHIHVLEAFDELGIKPAVISGSSIGAIMGAGYAAGMSGAQMREFVIGTLSNRKSILSRFWRMAEPGKSKWLGMLEFRFGELDPLNIMNAFMPETIPREFSELSIPLKIVVSDFYNMRQIVLDDGDLYKAMAGSAAIPILFRPQDIDGRIVVDGGIVNPVPFDVLAMEGVDKIIAVDVVGEPVGENPKLPNRVEIGYGTMQLMMNEITALKTSKNCPDLMIKPDIHKFKAMDFLKAEEILRSTEQTRTDTIVGLQKLLEAD